MSSYITRTVHWRCGKDFDRYVRLDLENLSMFSGGGWRVSVSNNGVITDKFFKTRTAAERHFDWILDQNARDIALFALLGED